MNEKVLSQKISEIAKTLADMIKRMKKIGNELDVNRAQIWLEVLQDEPSKDELNKLWSEIQVIGSRMNYMDYTDNEFRDASNKLKKQMLDVISEIRKNPANQKDGPN